MQVEEKAYGIGSQRALFDYIEKTAAVPAVPASRIGRFIDKLRGHNVERVVEEHYNKITNHPFTVRFEKERLAGGGNARGGSYYHPYGDVGDAKFYSKYYPEDMSAIQTYIQRVLRGEVRSGLDVPRSVNALPKAMRTKGRLDILEALQRGQQEVQAARMGTLKSRLGLGGATTVPTAIAGGVALTGDSNGSKSAAAQDTQDQRSGLGSVLPVATGAAVGAAPLAQGIASGALKMPLPKRLQITDLNKLREQIQLGDILLTGDPRIYGPRAAIAATGGDPFGYHAEAVTYPPAKSNKGLLEILQTTGSGTKGTNVGLGKEDVIIKRFKDQSNVRKFLRNMRRTESREKLLEHYLGKKTHGAMYDWGGAVRSGLKDLLPKFVRNKLPVCSTRPGEMFCSNLISKSSPVPLAKGIPPSEVLPHHILSSPELETIGYYRIPNRGLKLRMQEGLLRALPWAIRGGLGAALGYGAYRGVKALTD